MRWSDLVPANWPDGVCRCLCSSQVAGDTTVVRSIVLAASCLGVRSRQQTGVASWWSPVLVGYCAMNVLATRRQGVAPVAARSWASDHVDCDAWARGVAYTGVPSQGFQIVFRTVAFRTTSLVGSSAPAPDGDGGGALGFHRSRRLKKTIRAPSSMTIPTASM